MRTIHANATPVRRRFAAIPIVATLAVSVAAISAAIHDYYDGMDRDSSTFARFTGSSIQGTSPDTAVTPDYITEVGEALMAAE